MEISFKAFGDWNKHKADVAAHPCPAWTNRKRLCVLSKLNLG